MKLFRTVLKWTGITIALAVLSLIGFLVAAWLSPGDPGRVYLIAALAAGAASLLCGLILRASSRT